MAPSSLSSAVTFNTSEDYLELQGDDPVHFSIDREGDERVFVQDYIGPETLREMMVIVHEECVLKLLHSSVLQHSFRIALVLLLVWA